MSTDLDLLVRLPEREVGQVQAALDSVLAAGSWPKITGDALEFGDAGDGFGVSIALDLYDPEPTDTAGVMAVARPLCQLLANALSVPVILLDEQDSFDAGLTSLAS